MQTPILKSQNLREEHLIMTTIDLPNELNQWLSDKNFIKIDQWAQEATSKGGVLHRYLGTLLEFSSIETIIAIRKAGEDEEGIWHDDGSRILGFSLSLTRDYQKVVGGRLEFRPKGQIEFLSFPTQKIGTLICFKTGVYGFEHRVSKVSSGERIVIAGWCYN